MKKKLSANKDFDTDRLPHNRVEVFVDCIKMRFGTLCVLGLVGLVFLLPFLALQFFKDVYVNHVIYQASLNEITYEDAQLQITRIRNYIRLLSILAYILAGVGFSGIGEIIKKLVWGEPIFRSDFRDGIKSNCVHYVLIFALFGLSVFSSAFIGNTQNASVLTAIPFALLVWLVLPVMLLILSQTLVYTSNISECVRNGFLLYFKTMPKTLPAVLILCLPILLQLIPNMFVKYGCMIALVVLILPLMMMGWLLYSMYIFDKYINADHFPEYVDKGIYRDDSK